MKTLPKGFKDSDIGPIPQDWEVKEISEILVREPTYGLNASASPLHPRLPLYVRITDITEMGSYNPIDRVSVSHKDADKYVLHIGDILIARTGATVGKTYIHSENTYAVYAGYLIKLVCDINQCDYKFIFYNLQATRYYCWIDANSQRTGQPGINAQQIADYLVAQPSLREQQAIAGALSDIDALISAQEELLAKKRAIKQGAMQELLTGRRRLPGFPIRPMKQTDIGPIPEDWEVKQLDKLTSISAGGTPSTNYPEYWNGSIPWMSSGELHSKYISEVKGRITQCGLDNSAAQMLPCGCVLIGLAGQGKTRGTVAYNEIPLCTNQSIAAIFPDSHFISLFVYHYLDNQYYELRALSSGDGGRGGLNIKILGTVSVPFPSLAEQESIAMILSNMDAEITAVEEELAKHRALKRGMMQELLSGRIRLPYKKSTHKKQNAGE